MRALSWDELARMTYDEMKAISARDEDFVVVLPATDGDRTRRFLNIESRYLTGSRSLSERLRYFVGAIVSRPPAPFISLWNRALMDGFRVDSVYEVANGVEVHFKRRSS